MVEERRNARLEVVAIDVVDLRRDFQRDAGAARDRDRNIGTLLRRDAAEEREIARLRPRAKRELCAGRPCGTVASQLTNGSGVR